MTEFLKDSQYRETQERIGLTEAKREEIDKLAQEDHTYKLANAEFFAIQIKLVSTTIQEMITCTEIRKIVRTQDRVRQGNKISETHCQGARIDNKTEWEIWTPSSSSSWWQSDR